MYQHSAKERWWRKGFSEIIILHEKSKTNMTEKKHEDAQRKQLRSNTNLLDLWLKEEKIGT